MAHLVSDIPRAICACCQRRDPPGCHLGLEPFKANDFFCGLVFLRAEHDELWPHMAVFYCDFDDAAEIAEAEDLKAVRIGDDILAADRPIDRQSAAGPESAVRTEVSRRSKAFPDSNGKAA